MFMVYDVAKAQMTVNGMLKHDPLPPRATFTKASQNGRQEYHFLYANF